MVHVVGAVFFKGEDILLFRRKGRSNFFEFPGGKQESGESEEEALKREIWEELGQPIQTLGRIGESIFNHNGKQIHLAVFLVKPQSWTFDLRVHSEAKWLKQDNISHSEIMPGDIPLLQPALNAISKANAGSVI